MSIHCNLRLHSPLKKVLNKLEDSYQTYVNTNKTHAMATHHRGTGQLPLEDAQTQENNIVPPYEPQEEIDIIEQNEQ